jgi:PTH1 family peptidyl-tRNA hydrolase
MLKWISNIFSSKQNTDCMNKFLIVGLGNIGAEYVYTHIYWIQNIGLLKEQLSFQTVKLVAAEYKFKGRTFSF